MHGSRHLSWTSFANGESLTSSLLFCHLHSGLVSLLNGTALLSHVELNMAVVTLVGRNSTVSSVGSSATADGALHNGMSDHALLDIKTTRLRVGNEVLEELKHGLHGFLGPSTNATRSLEFFSLSMSSSVSHVSLEWDDLLVLKNVLHVLDGFLELEALDGAGSLVSVLVVSSEIGNSGLGS